MLETSARLLRLLSLFQARRYWPGAELSERLEVTGRTLRRDVDRLRSLGYPVNSTSGTAGGYQLGAGASLPPLLLDDDEAVAVAVGLRTAASGTVSGIEEASLRALSKLEQVLPTRLRHRVTALHAFIVPLTASGPTVDANTLSAIAGACRDCAKIHFKYRSRDGAGTTREVEPHRLVHTGRRWYLAAWDTGRNNWRTFRLDRIEAKVSTGARFTPREAPDGDFAKYVTRSVAYTPYPQRARVTLHASAEMAAERVPQGAGVIEAIDEKSCLLSLGACSLDTISIYLALIGFEFEVHEPPELIERVGLLAQRFGGAAALARS
ncbi:MAG TPA: YafY family protein [Bryobacteraceae bacterium]|jgi:predicted DNA-binding transcriptional regulator YafY|nr:YafY family protein [Bryobacteraceae bacterium]